MKRYLPVALAAFFLSLLPVRADPAGTIDPAWRGVWEGSVEMEDGKLPITARVHERGVLVDLPLQNVYGFPAEALSTPTELVFTINGAGDPFIFACALGAPATPGGLTGASPAPSAAPGQRTASGKFQRGDSTAPLYFVFSSFQPDPASVFAFEGKGGRLRGTLALPKDGAAKPPVVILLAGAGNADRDNNNYAVPGRNDGFRQLAAALAAGGVASCRYDKRGTGESAYLVPSEDRLVFADFVDDAAACVRSIRATGRFGRVYLFGYAEGALVAAAAAAREKVDGVVAVCASGRGIKRVIEDESADVPDEYRKEMAAIFSELGAGRYVETVSPYLARFFRRSFQPYLASWLRFEPVAAFRAVPCPVVFLWGERDVQVGPADFVPLQEAMPDSRVVMVEGMNHVMKAVSIDLEENYAAFGDPDFPLAPKLVEETLAFIGR